MCMIYIVDGSKDQGFRNYAPEIVSFPDHKNGLETTLPQKMGHMTDTQIM